MINKDLVEFMAEHIGRALEVDLYLENWPDGEDYGTYVDVETLCSSRSGRVQAEVTRDGEYPKTITVDFKVDIEIHD